jgi:hypothetical protein
LISEGVFIRGGITIGELIHQDSGIIMGPALIDAYELEKNCAIYPRIVLSDKLINKLTYPIKQKKDRYPYHQYISRFEDGCVGFHQMTYFQVLQSWTKIEKEHLKNALSNIKHQIIVGLDSSFERSDIYGKYRWLKNQYDKLIILEEGVKDQFYELNENISGQNIHYSYTDDYYKK